jgi:hypothetical protein
MGQAHALITEVLTCYQVVASIVAEAEDLLRRRLSSLVVDVGRQNGPSRHAGARVTPAVVAKPRHAI